MNESNQIVEELKKCKDRDTILSIFKNKKIQSDLEKYQLLQNAMGNPITFSTHCMTDKELLDYEIAVFLDKSWKLGAAFKSVEEN